MIENARRKYKILFIEDDKVDQKAFERFVEKDGLPYEYTVAGSISEAKDFLKVKTYDVILADLMLGDGTAFDILEEIGEMPFVVITGSGDEEVAVKAIKAGAMDYIVKDNERHYLKVLPITVENAVKYHEKEKLYKMLSHAIMDIKDSVYFTDLDDKIIYVNDAFCRTYGYEKEEILGRDGAILWHLNSGTEYKQSLFPKAIKGGIKGEFLHKKQDGSFFPVLISRNLIKDDRKKELAIAGVVRDITERKLIEQQFQSLAHYDTLTSLPNRAFLMERLSQALIQARWSNNILALLFLDLDRFKTINDTFGHDTGDQMLKEVSQRLLGCVRDSDTVGRMGGDEFLIILPKITKVQDATIIAQRVNESLSEPFLLSGHECTIGASIGISQFPSDGKDAETLFKNADVAMYKAKEAGMNTYQFYNSTMNAASFQDLMLENKMRKALEYQEFLLHYQPQVDLKTSQVIGVEALIRWQDPDSGLIFSSEFIPLAEESGLIIPMGKWLIREACRQAKAWQLAGFSSLRMAINMSGKQFKQRNFVDLISDELKNSKLEPELLELELTESILLQSEVTSSVLNEFDKLGVKLSIDDFGTGYSSLSYLKKLPISKLKIDQSFVHGISHDPSDEEIIKAIINMAHNLNIKVIAEGVETKKQIKFLIEQGCDEAQGFLLCRPIPAEKLEQKLSKDGPTTIV